MITTLKDFIKLKMLIKHMAGQQTAYHLISTFVKTKETWLKLVLLELVI